MMARMVVPSRITALLLAVLLGLTVAACGDGDEATDAKKARAAAAKAFAAAYEPFQVELRRAIASSSRKGATGADKKASAAGARAAFAELGESLRAIDVPDAVRPVANAAIVAIDDVVEAFEAQANAPRSEVRERGEAGARAYGDADQAIQALRAALGLTEADSSLPQ